MSIITFVYYIWVTWKLRGVKVDDEKEEDNPDDVESVRKSVVSTRELNNEAHNNEREIGHNLRRFPSVSSLPANMSDQIYENSKPTHEDLNIHGHAQSASEKDSAFSEGEITPTRGGKIIPPKIRRTGSGYGIEHTESIANVLHRQPLSHMTHHPYGRKQDGMRDTSNNRTTYGYPQELATNSFTNTAFQNEGSRFETDDLYRTRGHRKSMPDWLRAALGDEVRQENVEDDDSEIAGCPPMNRTATMPSMNQKEFPLLNTSDEESICYPSISQEGRLHMKREGFRSRQPNSLPHQK
uniref:Uncharacterized protein n=1 Tax=Ciona savignyi TaxID=51511 RepID=H2Z7F1_CIOSA